MYVKPFEDFMVERFLLSIRNDIQAGARYQFKSTDDENSQKLFQALDAAAEQQSLDFNKQPLKIISVNGINLIPVLQGTEGIGFTENYISHLRDMVAGQNGIFKNTALVYIHNSMLDTLINSAIDLASDGQIWSPKVFQAELATVIKVKFANTVLANCLLDDQLNAIVGEAASVFGFASLYKSFSEGKIDFVELGLFPDPFLLTMNGQANQLRRRLDENRTLRQEIEFCVTNYGDQLENALTKFSEKFIKSNFDDLKWKTLDFGKYQAELESNKAPKLVLESFDVECESYELRARSATKAGQRDNSLLINYNPATKKIVLTMLFAGSDLSKSQVKITAPGNDILYTMEVTRPNGKYAYSVEIKPQKKVSFFTVEIKRDNRAEEHKFRCLLVEDQLFDFSEIKTKFKVEPAKSILTLQLEETKVQISKHSELTWTLESTLDVIDSSIYGIVDFEQIENQSDIIQFKINNAGSEITVNIEGASAESGLATPLLFDKERYQKLFRDEGNAEYSNSKRRVIIDNSEHILAGVRAQLIDFEYSMVKDQILYQGQVEPFALADIKDCYPKLQNAYRNLYNYYETHNTLPSLCAWGPIYQSTVQNVLDEFEEALESIKLNNVLSAHERKLLHIGCHVTSEGKERLSPIHPLVLAYHIQLVRKIVEEKNELESSSFYELPDVTLDRLVTSGLLPYVYHSDTDYSNLQPVRENQFWIEIIPQRKSSNHYVRKLVRDKLLEFTTAYTRLFETGKNSKLMVNAVNQGYARELFLGIVDFFKAQGVESGCALHVNFYDPTQVYNYFDEFADSGQYANANRLIGGRNNVIRSETDALTDFIRTQLTYSKFSAPSNSSEMSYAHLAFFKNDVPVDKQDVNIDNQLSGVLANGLICGEAAETKGSSYFTAFGLRNVDTTHIQSLRLARYLGMLWKPSRHPNAQYLGTGIGLAVTTGFKDLLTCSYDSALWTTIIDPKVTLDFFASQKDVVLIHYSDQYTSSAGYDAITVTKQVELFQRLIKADSSTGSEHLLAEFNAFNGEWLLKMMTSSPKDRKEKHGIIGAYKFVRSILHKSDICWVPLSVAEIIRVSGNVGLRMSESDFSRRMAGYRKGAISDDVLFVGFHESGMYLLPLEVKTGARPDTEYAVEQASELKRYLIEILRPRTLAGQMFRSLFSRQVFIQLEKFQLYKVLVSACSDELIENRQYWLRGDYEIKDLENYPDGFTLSHIDSDCCFTPAFKLHSKNILQIELPYSLLGTLIAADTESTLNTFVSTCNVPKQFLLSGTHGIYSDAVSTPLVTNADQGPKAELVTNHALIENESLSPGDATHPHILFGHDLQNGSPLYWEPTNTSKFMNTNTGIIGTMGTGKTQFTKSLVTQLVTSKPNGKETAPIGFLIFDYKSDYVDDEFTSINQAKHLRLHKLPFNPLSLFGSMPMLPLHTANAFSGTLSKAFGLGQKQQLRLRNIILEAYDQAGISKSDSSTWSKPCPTIAMVWDIFLNKEKVEEDSLYAALDSLATYEFFEADPTAVSSLYDILDGVVVIELAGYSTQIQNLIVALTLDLFYAQMQKHGKPTVKGHHRQVTKMILVDEADNFMKEDFDSLRKILKEGREYGVGAILSTQEITHFKTGENNYASYILTWIVHRVSEIKNADVKALFNKDDKSDQDRLMEEIRKLEKHHSLYVDGDKKILKMRDHAFWELNLNM